MPRHLRIHVEHLDDDGQPIADLTATLAVDQVNLADVLNAAQNAAAAEAPSAPAEASAKPETPPPPSDSPSPPPPGSHPIQHLDPGKKAAWSKFVARLADDGDLWEGFEGMEPHDILQAPGVHREIKCLELLGVRDPIRWVLIYGPERCWQARDWTKRWKKHEPVHNEAGCVVHILKKGPPRGAQPQRRRA